MSKNNIIALPRPSIEEIRTEAYYRFLNRTAEGRPGNAQTDWQEASDFLFSNDQSDSFDSAGSSIDAELGQVFSSRPDHADKLTTIKGVGPVNEKHLNEFGVYCFDQIANWTPEIAAAFAERIGFKNRVTKEDWIGQAKVLAAASAKVA